jgi:hypothetical protein
MLASPWAEESNLKSVVLTEALGADVFDSLPMSRAEAITIPAVAKAENLLTGTIQKFPLVALDDNGVLASQPAFLSRTETAVTPVERIAWTVDDLIFYGMALWTVERDADEQIISANYCPEALWKFNKDGFIEVEDKLVDESEVLLFNMPFSGLLNVASRTLRGARDMEESWTSRVRSPIPAAIFSHIDPNDVQRTQDEVDGLLADWRINRRDKDGAVAYIPPGLKFEALGTVDAMLNIEGRNGVRTDVGSFLNVPVAMLDGTIGVDSLTYSTTEGNRNRFLDESVPFWTDPIEARLSMDDVVPEGQRVRFDKSEAYALIPAPTDIPERD